MPRFSDWDDESNEGLSSGGGEGELFKKLEPGTHVIRLIDKPLKYYQFWEPVVCRSPYQNKDGDIICPLMQMGLEPKPRYSAWIVDRADGCLKVMDFPPTLFKYFRMWHEATGLNPGGKEGCDWEIKVIAPSGKQQYKKYEAKSLGKAPFTQDEINKIKSGNLAQRIMELRKDNTPEEIREMLEKAGVSRHNTTQTRTAKSPAQASQPASEDSNEFGGVDF